MVVGQLEVFANYYFDSRFLDSLKIIGILLSQFAVPDYTGLLKYTTYVQIGLSGVRALPLAAGLNVGGHYKWHFFLFLSFSLSPAHC